MDRIATTILSITVLLTVFFALSALLFFPLLVLLFFSLPALFFLTPPALFFFPIFPMFRHQILLNIVYKTTPKLSTNKND